MPLMPGAKPYQSKLIPYLELIRELRSSYTTYPEIARILREEHQLEVAPSTIFDFVKRRSRRREVYALAPDPAAATSPPSPPTTHPDNPSPQPPQPPTTTPTNTQEPRHEKRRSVSAAKEAIAARTQAADKPARSAGWAAFKRDVDPTKPLTFIKPNSDQSNDTHAN